MPKVNIDKSILVNTTPDKVYSIISDFKQWKPWSPWLITDPETKLNYREDGKHYDWNGEVTGTGHMTILKEEENKQVDYDLVFLKPFKSKAKVSFVLIPEGDGTRVHWKMDSSLPFFMFFLKKMMVTFVGMDYELGLTMLKDFAETGKVGSELTFKGYETFEGKAYVGIKTTCTVKGISEAMSRDYTKLMGYMMGEHQDSISGHSFSIYHKWDPIKDVVEYTACVPVKEGFDKLLDGMFIGSVPTTKAHTIHHKGSYKFAGNVWSAQYGRQRAKMFKMNKKVHPMEVYLNSPKNTPETELESEVVFPVI